MTQTTVEQLPAIVRSFLAAHHVRDADAALRTFTPTAVVVDDGMTYRGSEAIGGFLSKAGAEFTYTTTLVAVERDDDRWVAVHHLEGDFPGGVVDLRYRFTLDADLIAELVIAP